ncbi:hypothetical protein EDB87DRAFT_1631642 [Lactarius vividus]|nr:hypothetical protein EDB87DRAFT_1631642 [Lactarius vividus]
MLMGLFHLAIWNTFCGECWTTANGWELRGVALAMTMSTSAVRSNSPSYLARFSPVLFNDDRQDHRTSWGVSRRCSAAFSECALDPVSLTISKRLDVWSYRARGARTP